MSGYVKARRAHSMPSRFVLPSEYMGEYEEKSAPMRRRSAPTRGKLYPLREEGAYGGPPLPPPGYIGREKKPKIYSSYAVDHGCAIHSRRLSSVERDRDISNRKASVPGRNSVSPSRRTSSSRGTSSDRVSSSPEPIMNGYGPRKTSQPRKNSGRLPKHNTATWTSSTSTTRRYSNMNGGGRRFNDLRNSSFEENEEYEYVENQRRNKMNNDDFDRITYKMGQVSLDGLRKPKINSWDSMGILGLSNKMWSDTRKRQESFLTTTGHFLREDDFGSYIM